jgi:anti-sigma factor RsiW
MTCDAVLDTIELIASGEQSPDTATAAHLAACASCASALAAARRLEALLMERPAVAPSAQFTTRTMTRIRRARWRNEQMIDWGFNAVLVAVAAAVGMGIWIVASQTGVAFVGGDARELLATSMRSFVQRVAPSLPLYALATALVATALGIWWWAERPQLFDR